MEFIKDIHGKISTKRVFGGLAMLVGLLMAIFTGFNWYEVSELIIGEVLGAGTGLLGMSAFERKQGK